MNRHFRAQTPTRLTTNWLKNISKKRSHPAGNPHVSFSLCHDDKLPRLRRGQKKVTGRWREKCQKKMTTTFKAVINSAFTISLFFPLFLFAGENTKGDGF